MVSTNEGGSSVDILTSDKRLQCQMKKVYVLRPQCEDEISTYN